jgi:uridine kinase
MNDITVSLPGGQRSTVAYGTRVGELVVPSGSDTAWGPVVAALVNNELVSLSYKVKINASVRPVLLSSAEGATVYRRSLCFMLAMAVRKLFPGERLVIGHSLGDGYFYHFENQADCQVADLERLESFMRGLVARDLPIQRSVLAYHEAVEYLTAHGQTATAELLDFRNESKIPVCICGDFMDLAHGPLAPSTGLLKEFQIKCYETGFILRFPSGGSFVIADRFRDSSLLFSIYREYKSWGKILNISSVGRLNRITASGRGIKEFIHVAETLHNKKLTEIADKILKRKGEVKIILIAGPSSSGKTTFTKRLSVELQVLGFNSSLVSLDDYFLSREQTPRDENGEYDFESLEALDVGLLNDHLLRLFRGEEVELPVFEFKLGLRRDQGRKLRLDERGILLIEGIHGLNDRLTPLIERSRKFKVYVSALTQLNLDENNRISTTDNRLIRRLVRDHQFRGHPALRTLGMWPSVRRGENRNIFPFQDSADTAFNSALDYELGVLKPFAETLLRSVKPDHAVYHEAMRLLSFLANFLSIPVKHVPEYSILREFIGDSGFRY